MQANIYKKIMIRRLQESQKGSNTKKYPMRYFNHWHPHNLTFNLINVGDYIVQTILKSSTDLNLTYTITGQVESYRSDGEYRLYEIDDCTIFLHQTHQKAIRKL